MRLREMVFLLMAFVAASVGADDTAVGVITAIDHPGSVTLSGESSRRGELFAVVRPGEQVIVEDGAVTLRQAGKDIQVTRANSPFTLTAEQTGSSVSGNVVDWVLAVLGSDDDDALPDSVAMASRGFRSLDLYLVSPFRNQLQRRDRLVVAHGKERVPDKAVVLHDGPPQALAVERLSPGFSALDTRHLKPGEYQLKICEGERCRQLTVDWQEQLDGDLPKGYSQLPVPLSAFALVRDDGAFSLEALQQFWGVQEDNELVARFMARLTKGSQQ